MLEKPSPKSFDPKALMNAHVIGVKEQEKIYGPVFTSRLVEHALRFAAQRIGEKPPENIKTVEQVAQYLLSKIDKYPTPQCAIMYAQYKTEKELQGQAGTGRRLGEIGWQRKSIETRSGEKKNIDLDGLISQFWQVATMMKMSPIDLGYKKTEDGSLVILVPNCFYKDGCHQAFKEGLLGRPDGGMICNLGVTVCVYLKAATGFEWDSNCLEYDKPPCIVKHLML
jgi:hypothetical protein